MTESVDVRSGADGLTVTAPAYRLMIPDGSAYARLEDADGEPWAELLLDASLHARSGLDETTARQPAVVRAEGDAWSAIVPLASSLWQRKELRLRGDATSIRVRAAIEGDGQLADVHLLGAWSSAMPNGATGFMRSGSAFRTLFTPEPEDPARLSRPAAEPATLDVHGGTAPGRLHWFFTPPPYCLAFSRTTSGSDRSIPVGPWLTMGISAPAAELTFGSVHYEPAERSFSIRIAYEGQTRFVGRFETPEVTLLFGAPDPYAGVGAWSDDLRAHGFAPPDASASPPGWWLEPIFCGWGAQAALAAASGSAIADHGTQQAYDVFLAELGAEGLDPGTIVVDDKWQSAYGTGEPDPRRWPDLRSWIAERHAGGQRVLLWWKAWDPEGLPADMCVRNRQGAVVAADPSNPAYEAYLRTAIRRLVSPTGFDADGLKVDLTARTPAGPGLRRHGPEWGTSLLLKLLWILHDEAHRAKPDALVITHAPHPSFAATTDMLRLNDMLRLSEPDDHASAVEQMAHRARIVRAACPGVPIDTDDWSAPDLASWRRYLALKPRLGVPALYYTTTIDRTGERLEAADYAAIREVWAEARRSAALVREGERARRPTEVGS